MRAILILVHSDRRHRIDTFPLVIGRGDDADLHVPDPLVSRRHCRIDAVKGTLLLEDLGSRNGTCVNGCLVESSPLLPGDHVGLGSHVFRVVYERISLDEPPRTVYRGTDESSRHCESTFR